MPLDTFDIFRLPREIRDLIYFYLVVSDDPVFFSLDLETFHTGKNCTPAIIDVPQFWMVEPAAKALVLMHTGSAINNPPQAMVEASEMFYRTNQFKVDGPTLPTFLNLGLYEMGDETVSASRAWVRSMAITVKMCQPRSGQQYLKRISSLHGLIYCPNLRRLDLQVHGITDSLLGAANALVRIGEVCMKFRRKFLSAFAVSLSYSPKLPEQFAKADLGWISDASTPSALGTRQETTKSKQILSTAFTNLSLQLRMDRLRDHVDVGEFMGAHGLVLTAYELQLRLLREQEETAHMSQDGTFKKTEDWKLLDGVLASVARFRWVFVQNISIGGRGEDWVRLLVSDPLESRDTFHSPSSS